MNIEYWDKIVQNRLKILRNKAGAKGNILKPENLIDECKKVIHEGTV